MIEFTVPPPYHRFRIPPAAGETGPRYRVQGRHDSGASIAAEKGTYQMPSEEAERTSETARHPGVSPLLYGLVFAGIVVGASAFRLIALENRPMHGDEANQAYRAGVLLETGRYAYDPQEHHGPSLYYLTLPIMWATGCTTFAETSELTYRLLPALFGIGLVLLLLLVRDAMGRRATLWAALLTAVSPAMVFYSRYYIQETLLVFFTFLTIACGWRHVRSGRAGWAVAGGLGIGLMHATKETCVLAYLALAVGLAAVYPAIRRAGGLRASLARHPRLKLHLVLAAAVASGISVLLFSSFFSNASGPLDSVRAFGTYLGRGAGNAEAGQGPGAHVHPWYFYLRLLAYTKRGPGAPWSEGLILLLALAGAASAFFPERSPGGKGFQRFVAVYTLALVVLYAVIPYKTPWCMLGFLHGLILLAGLGAAALVGAPPKRGIPGFLAGVLIAVALLAGIGHLAVQSYRASFVYPADMRNPYVYAHTAPPIRRLVERVEELARLHPDRRGIRIHVVVPDGDYWPLPFYFRSFDHVGYWDSAPAQLDAPIIVTSPEMAKEWAKRLKQEYHKERHGLRPGVHLVLYVQKDLWEAFMETRSHAKQYL